MALIGFVWALIGCDMRVIDRVVCCPFADTEVGERQTCVVC